MNKPKLSSALGLFQTFASARIENGDFCVDATMGKGRDTAFLAKIVGKSGKVISFDIQKEALSQTKELLTKEDLLSNVTLINDGHQNIKKYVDDNTADVIVFNLGYMPGGDHNITTMTDTTKSAVISSFDIIKPGGLIFVCIYYGHTEGLNEKNMLLDFLKEVDYKRFSVSLHSYCNQPNDPPCLIMIEKL